MKNNLPESPRKQISFKRVSPFVWLIVGTITISCGLVWISLALYNNSGAAQLDLSRPSYQSVREEAQKNTQKVDTGSNFPSTGKLDKDAFAEFDEKYKAQHEAVLKDADGFSPAPLEDTALDIEVE